MEGPLARLIASVVNEQLTMEEAEARAASLASAGTSLVPEIRRLAVEVDGLRGRAVPYELVASRLLWAASTQIADLELRAVLAYTLARSMIAVGDGDAAESLLQITESFVRRRNDRAKLPSILGTRAGLCLSRGDTSTALTLFTESRALARELEDHGAEAASEMGIGQILLTRHDLGGAHASLRRARELYQSSGDRIPESQTLHLLAETFSAPDEGAQRVVVSL